MNTNNQGIKIDYTSSKVIDISLNTLSKNHIIAWNDKNKHADHYKIIKTQIQQKLKQNGFSTLAITSPRSGEGKTTTSINAFPVLR